MQKGERYTFGERKNGRGERERETDTHVQIFYHLCIKLSLLNAFIEFLVKFLSKQLTQIRVNVFYVPQVQLLIRLL